MVETQSSTSETKVEGVEAAKAATARVEQKAREVIDALVDTYTKWAGVSLGFGRSALTTSARALDRAADRLAVLEKKFEKTPAEASAAPETTPPEVAPAAPETTSPEAAPVDPNAN